MITETQAFSLLMTLLRSELAEEPLPESVKGVIDEEAVMALYVLSARFDLSHTVGDALSKAGLLSDVAKEKFKKWQYLAFFRYQRSEYELSEMRRVLDEAGIPYMPLKGTVIRDLYPDPAMRVSCDIDILVPKERAMEAKALFTDKLGYRYDGMGDHDHQFFTPSELVIELHFQLYKTEDRVVYALGDVKEHMDLVAEDRLEYRMSGAYLYAYMIAHMAKHFHEGGCGVKPFADLYVMQKRMSYDREEALSMLKEAGLYRFTLAMEALTEYWFSDGKKPKDCDEIVSYLIEGGAYGGIQGCLVSKKGAKSGLSYLLGRIFIPFSEMAERYPRLLRCKLLLPFYYVKRIFAILFSKEKEAVRSAAKDTCALDKKKAKRILSMYERLEIDAWES